MGTPRLVFLYGPPAVGKLTVARAIAKRRPFKILHNHLTIDPVAQVLPFGSDAFWRVVGRLRGDLVEAAAAARIDLIFTFVFAAGEEQLVSELTAPYNEIGGAVSYVQLLAPREVLLQRVLAEDRQEHGKIGERETLERLLDEHDTFAAISGLESLSIDMGDTSAEEAATRILSYVSAE